MTPLLEVAGLTVRLPVSGEIRTVLDGVSFSARPRRGAGAGGRVGIGKVDDGAVDLAAAAAGAEVDGTVAFDGRDVYSLRGGQLRARTRHEDRGGVSRIPAPTPIRCGGSATS